MTERQAIDNQRDLVAHLARILRPGLVLTDPAELLVYECDGFTIARGIPTAVVFPQTSDEVAEVVRVITAHGAQVVPRGSGTGLAGGCVAFDFGVVVSTARMNRVLSIDLPNRVAHVQAGVRNTALTDELSLLPGGARWHYSPDPSSQRASTIGGNAATNAGGIHVLKDFVTSNHVLGIEMVQADGQIVRLGASNGSYESPGGFDLPGLVCGSEGTLGVITSLWVRLVPRQGGFRTILAVFDSTRNACNAVSDVIAEGFLPGAMEMLDGQMVQIVEDAFALGIPRSAQALILTEIDGADALLDAPMETIARIMRRNGGREVQTTTDPQVRDKLWKARKSAFGAIGRISPSYCTQDACVPRSRLAEVLERIDTIGKTHGLRISNVFHAGDGNVHPIFLYDDRDPAQVKNVLSAADEILKFCIDLGGTLTGEHGVGVEKIHLMPYLFDQATLEAFRKIKGAFDPEARINADKLIPKPSA